MPPLHVYGIKNCDTMKKALAWLDSHAIAYIFHDYKKEGADRAVIAQAIAQLGWESVINRKGSTWRTLSEAARDGMTQGKALQAARDNPSLIKRPLLHDGKKFYIGFSEENFAELFT